MNPALHTTLSSSISHVNLLCAKKEVIRPYTRRIVTLMQDSKSFWNRSIVQFPRNPISPCGSKPAIAFVLESCPVPAGFGYVNVTPKPYFHRNTKAGGGTCFAAVAGCVILRLKHFATGRTLDRFQSGMALVTALHRAILSALVFGQKRFTAKVARLLEHANMVARLSCYVNPTVDEDTGGTIIVT